MPQTAACAAGAGYPPLLRKAYAGTGLNPFSLESCRKSFAKLPFSAIIHLNGFYFLFFL
jgi:hypothetical protein